MKLRRLKLRNFRSYQQETTIEFSDLTAFIGKNDAGKSTILEALEIFFNNDAVKIEPADASINGDNKDVAIACVFDDLPPTVVIDSTNETNLEREYLTNLQGELEIHKIFNCSTRSAPKVSLFANANHPSIEGFDNLLNLTIPQLRTTWKGLGATDDNVKLNVSASIRQGIWTSCDDLKLNERLITLDEAEGKKIWTSLSRYLPIFGLFRADRPSRDEDSEVQDPLKLAVKDALSELDNQLTEIQEVVQSKVLDVANRTVAKIKEMDPNLAQSLVPHFKSEPKWDTLFKLALTADDEIPINKRGSGVRRLVLMNFFRAEVERRQHEANTQDVIYAVEEPETSQHPNHQKMLIDAFRDLSSQENCQVLLTTHVPGLAGSIPVEDLRFVERDDQGDQCIRSGDDEVYEEICASLGVLPEHRPHGVQLFICVEGPTDVPFIHRISQLYNTIDPELPDIMQDDRVVVFPLGGSSLALWATHHYLRKMNIPEFHIYDRDDDNPPKYAKHCQTVNARTDGSWATLTKRREIENYYHPDIVFKLFGVKITYSNTDDVPQMISDTLTNNNMTKRNPNKVKQRLAEFGPAEMTTTRLQAVDIDGELRSWFAGVASKLK